MHVDRTHSLEGIVIVSNAQEVSFPNQEEIPRKLPADKRIARFAQFLFFTLLILPIYFKGWQNVKKLYLESYDGVERNDQLVVRVEASSSNSGCLGLFSFNNEINNLDQYVQQECVNLESEVHILRSRLRDFDKFIIDNRELYNACQAYLRQFPEYIAPTTEIPKHLVKSENLYEKRTKLRLEKNNLELLISERDRFFKRHQEVYDAFQNALRRHP